VTRTRWAAAGLVLALAGSGCGGEEHEPRPSGPSMRPMAPRASKGGAPGRTQRASDANRAPRIAGVRIEPAAPVAGEPLRAIVDASDPDGDRIHYDFTWRVGDRRFSAAGDFLEHVRSKKGDVVEVTVTARDDRAESVPFRSETIVRNSPPRIVQVAIEAEELQPGDEVEAKTTAEDRDGDPLSYEYRWRVNGITASGTGATFSTRGLRRGDALSVEVVASDGTDWSEGVRSEDVRLGNGVPVIVSQPSPPGADGVFRYRVVAEDPDGDRDLRVSLGDAPEGMVVDAKTGEVTWRPTHQQAGRHRVEVVVTDSAGGRATQSFQIVVGDDAPASPAP
jgi:hypothetical protein